MPNTIKITGIVLLMVLLLSLSCNGLLEENSSPEGIDVVEEAWQIVLEDFVDTQDLSSEELAEGAIRGLIESLDDPYTSYLNPEQNELSKADREGDFSGIGATLTIKDGDLTIVAPIAGSPAEEAGIKAGDKILEVDDEPVEGMGLTEVTLRIRGEKGTVVKLLVLHVNDQVPVEIEITRETIEVPSVVFEMLANDIAHIKVNEFTERTDSELESVLKEAIASEVSGIILDLRDNPGGLVNAAVAVVSQFVDDEIVLYALDNEGKRTEWKTDDRQLALEIPLVVLVNENSASASEVVTGALQDYGRGTIIGTTTFGKGSMNHVFELENGGALHITFALWYTPNGRQIQGEGITPDIEIGITPEDIEAGRDPQLERAIGYLNETK